MERGVRFAAAVVRGWEGRGANPPCIMIYNLDDFGGAGVEEEAAGSFRSSALVTYETTTVMSSILPPRYMKPTCNKRTIRMGFRVGHKGFRVTA